MLYYEIKLINPETKEVYYKVTSEKPQLPTKEEMDRHKGAMLVVRTTMTPKED